MKVIINKGHAVDSGAKERHEAGDIVDLPEELATRLIKSGAAKAETAKTKPAATAAKKEG